MPRKYSNKTLATLADFMERYFTHPELTFLFLYASVPDTSPSGANKLTRSLNAIMYLSRSDEFTGEMEHGDQVDDLFDEIINRRQSAFESPIDSESSSEEADTLRRALMADGYDIVAGKIVPSDALAAEMASELSILEQRLQAHDMDDVQQNLDDAHDNYIRGKPAACNAMLRSALESTLKHIAVKIAGSADKIHLRNPGRGLSASNIRIYLEDQGYFEEDEIKFIKEFFGYASTNGSHPGMSNEAESRLRRLMVVALIQYSLEKLEAKLPQ